MTKANVKTKEVTPNRLHEFREISQRRSDKQVKVVIHENIAMEFDGVNINRLIELSKKATPIRVITKNILLLIASTGDMVNSVGVLYAQRSCHDGEYCT